MNNTVILSIYVFFTVVTTVVFFIEFARHKKNPEDYFFLLACLCVLGWFLSDILALVSTDPVRIEFLVNLSLVFVSLTPPVLLLFSLKFYRAEYKLTPLKLILLFLVPVVTTVFSLTGVSHALMTRQVEIISFSPLQEKIVKWGIWFWVHTVYSYVISMAVVCVILYKHFRMPKFYRMPSKMMVIAITLSLAGNVVNLAVLLPSAIDPTLVAIGMALVFFYLAIINNDQNKFARYSRSQVFHYLDAYILALGKNHNIVDYNKPALEWFSSLGISLNSAGFGDIMEALKQKGAETKEPSGEDEGLDMYFSGGDFPFVINLREHKMTDSKAETIGSIAVFTDVTQNRTLIEQLEAKAGVDALTGIPNRMAFEGAKKRLEAAEFLPLSVIMCDVNGLKAVNDTYGHRYGDVLLRVMARVFEQVCPDNGFLARIGGDEFVFLLPQMPHDDALALMVRLEDGLSKRENLPFAVSSALGTATKNSKDENLDDIITLADTRMYEDKRLNK